MNWAVHAQINNQPSQAKRCNLSLTIKRTVPEEVNEYGYLVAEEQEVLFIDRLPVCIYQYDGRPDYAPSYNTLGIGPDALTIVDMQWNAKTSKIVVNDEFMWGSSLFRVININMSGVNLDHTAGLLQLHARRVAGSERID